MKNQQRVSGYLALALLAISALQLAACSDATSPGPHPALISGSVVGPAGNPIEDAAILVSFRPTFEDILYPEKGMTALTDMPPAEVFWIRISNACGDTIRTLCDEGCNDFGSIYWDGLDDAGLRAVEGIYWYTVAIPGGFNSQEFVLIHNYTEWNTEDCQAHASANSDGRYSLSDDCLGFGELVTVTDEEGNIVDERPMGRVVNLRAVSPNGSVARRDSVRFPSSGSLTVDFILPQ